MSMRMYICTYIYIYICVDVFGNPVRRNQLENAAVLQDVSLKFLTLRAISPF